MTIILLSRPALITKKSGHFAFPQKILPELTIYPV